MRAIDNPLGENATGGGNDLGRVKHAQGRAVPENQNVSQFEQSPGREAD